MLEKRYDFAAIEREYAQKWEKSGCFDVVMDGREPFVIMMPPPNVTGTLHLGHALDNTAPDILIRRARMQGKDALYQPGTDHASIAVHVVLEREWRKEGKSRFDMGREAFLEKAWEWKDYSHGIIAGQMRRLGISCNWENERFTMDPAYVRAVNEAFITLYNKGLIYRGQRLVNWDPKMQTAVSDLEVKHKEVKGYLWHVRYYFADGFTYNGENGIEIATTRPETILADGAIAIHPDDKRAKDLVGRKVLVPMVNREIYIVADDMVDPEFGSGMVKITAAHDFNDFGFYQRHKGTVDVPLINLLTRDGKMNENCPAAYQGLDRFEARKRIVADLEKMGQIIKIEDHVHNVGHAERDDTVLEPYLTWQWYVSAKSVAEKCLKVADEGQLTFVNDRDAKVYRNWLENIEDWCISRQLWWGHRIPAWFKNNPQTGEQEVYVGDKAPVGEGWVQDDDILDTWFSSGLWAFATQGWPETNERLSTFYPNTAIMSGRDILFFWLVRMVMMGLELTEKLPFKTIYTHGMILDEHGQKMSKTKGNVTDPMDIINEYGADALRFTMASIASSEDMRFSKAKVEQYRNFCTKLWNAARFLMMNDVRFTAEDAASFKVESIRHPVNQWIVSKLSDVLHDVDSALDRFDFGAAAQAGYHFTWGTWCDWYLELTKPILNGDDVSLAEETRKTMGWAFDKLLKMMHPFVPFITEEIWQNLTLDTFNSYLMVQRWPDVKPLKEWGNGEEVDWLVEMVSTVRTLRTLHHIPPKTGVVVDIRAGENAAQLCALVDKYGAMLDGLASIKGAKMRTEGAGRGDLPFAIKGQEYLLPLAGVVDLDAERKRLESSLEKLMAERSKIDGMLSDENFVKRAPEKVVFENKERREHLNVQIGLTHEMLEGPYKLS